MLSCVLMKGHQRTAFLCADVSALLSKALFYGLSGGLHGRSVNKGQVWLEPKISIRTASFSAAFILSVFAGIVLICGATAFAGEPSIANGPMPKATEARHGEESAPGCREATFEDHPYIVCRFHPDHDDIRLFLNDDEGKPLRHFTAVNETLAAGGEILSFAMNAGMYHKDRSPVGLYVEGGQEASALNLNKGPGNFHMLPNGVFVIYHEASRQTAIVHESNDMAAFWDVQMAKDATAYATQSGPMLVIDGKLHPRFLTDSESLKRRNGVGVRKDGTVLFAISDAAVNFHEFARLFRDELDCPNALYLDGTISRLHAPELGRSDPGLAMGPIVGVVVER